MPDNNSELMRIIDTLRRMNSHGSLDGLNNKLSALKNNFSALSQSRSIPTLANQIEKLSNSLGGLSSSDSIRQFGKDISGLANSVSTRFPEIRNEFSLLNAEIQKVNRQAMSFGSALRKTLDEDLRNPLDQFEEHLTEMFSPNGTVYGAMNDYFDKLFKKVSELNNNLKQTYDDLNKISDKTIGVNINNGGGYGSGGSGGRTVLPLSVSPLQEALAFMVESIYKAARAIDNNVSTINQAKNTMGLTTNSPQFQQIFKQTYGEFRQLNGSGIYSQSDYSKALLSAVNAGARGSDLNALLPVFLRQEKLNPNGLDPSTSNLLFQIYQRTGSASQVQSLQNTLLKAGTLRGVANGGQGVFSTLGDENSLIGMLDNKNIGSGSNNLAQLNTAVAAASNNNPQAMGMLSGFFQNLMTANKDQINELVKMMPNSGGSIFNTISMAQKGNFTGAFNTLLDNYASLQQDVKSNPELASIMLGQFGYDPQTQAVLSNLNHNRNVYNSTLNQVGNTNNIVQNQTSSVQSSTSWLKQLTDKLSSTSTAQFLTNHANLSQIPATEIVDTLIGILGANFLSKHKTGRGIGGNIGHFLGLGLKKIGIGRKGKNGKVSGVLGDIESEVFGGQVFNPPKMFKGISHANPLPVYVVNLGGSGIGSNAVKDLENLGKDESLVKDAEKVGGKLTARARLGRKIRDIGERFHIGGQGFYGTKNGKTVGEHISKLGDLIENFSLKGTVGKTIGKPIGKITDVLSKVTHTVGKVTGMTATKSFLGKTMTGAKGVIGKALESMGGKTILGFAKYIGGPAGIIMSADGIVHDAIDGYKAKNTKTKVSDYGKAIGATVGTIAGTVFFGPLGGAIGGFAGKYLGEGVASIINNWDKISSGFVNGIKAVGSWLGNFFGGIANAFGNFILQTIPNAIDSLPLPGWAKTALKATVNFIDGADYIKMGQAITGGSTAYASTGATPVNYNGIPTGVRFLSQGGPTITSNYGMRFDPINGQYGFHPGVDISANSGTPIHNPIAGVVGAVGYDPNYGTHTVIHGVDGLSRIFGHSGGITVQKGQIVGRGQRIGRVGSTGKSTGPHVHYEVRNGKTPVPPMGGPTGISGFYPYALTVSQRTGLPVAYVLTQWMAEEGLNGGNQVTDQDNNYAGIKWNYGHPEWTPYATGPGSKATDDGGVYAHYNSVEDFAKGYAGFLLVNSNYRRLISDARSGKSLSTLFADVAGGGYATSGSYYDSLMQDSSYVISQLNRKGYKTGNVGDQSTYGVGSGSPSSGGGSGSSSVSVPSNDPFAGKYTSTHNSGDSQKIYDAVMSASKGAVVKNYQASLAQSTALGDVGSASNKTGTINDLIDSINKLRSEQQETNKHLAEQKAIAIQTHNALKKSSTSHKLNNMSGFH